MSTPALALGVLLLGVGLLGVGLLSLELEEPPQAVNTVKESSDKSINFVIKHPKTINLNADAIKQREEKMLIISLFVFSADKLTKISDGRLN